MGLRASFAALDRLAVARPQNLLDPLPAPPVTEPMLAEMAFIPGLELGAQARTLIGVLGREITQRLVDPSQRRVIGGHVLVLAPAELSVEHQELVPLPNEVSRHRRHSWLLSQFSLLLTWTANTWCGSLTPLN